MSDGREVHFDATKWFAICAEHAKQLSQPGMEMWEFEPLSVTGVQRPARHCFAENTFPVHFESSVKRRPTKYEIATIKLPKKLLGLL
jgi:hypothetical protein